MIGTHHLRRAAIGMLTGVMLLTCAPVGAVTRAWLDRDSANAGDVVMLNIETDQRGVDPDYTPLRNDFTLGAKSANQQMQVTNGSVTVRALFGVVLTPRKSGELIVPAIRVGNERTEPLRLQVGASANDAGSSAPGAAAAAQGNEDAFVQTQVDDPQPYVQQSVGVVVRLYFATQLASGELDLEAPDGASLQRIGDDVSSVKVLNNRQYNVVERRYLLVPERSGRLVLPSARFNGRSVGGFFDDYFGRGNGELSARSASIPLQVRAQPANAPQPWLPLRSLQLRYTTTPQRATAGEAAQIVVEASARGATQAQFPDLPTPSVPDAQVFAEPAQYEERFVDGSPQLRLTRRYSIVPNRAGPLVVPGLQVAWWMWRGGGQDGLAAGSDAGCGGRYRCVCGAGTCAVSQFVTGEPCYHACSQHAEPAATGGHATAVGLDRCGDGLCAAVDCHPGVGLVTASRRFARRAGAQCRRCSRARPACDPRCGQIATRARHRQHGRCGRGAMWHGRRCRHRQRAGRVERPGPARGGGADAARPLGRRW